MRLRRRADLHRTDAAVATLDLPRAVWRTCPWEPRDVIDLGLRQWLRCAGAALRDGQTIGMPSRAVDEAWHGFILCTAQYAQFCDAAYGRFLHHHPEGAATTDPGPRAMGEQLARTVTAWTIVRHPAEDCVLWDLDTRVGVREPWGISGDDVAAVLTRIGAR